MPVGPVCGGVSLLILRRVVLNLHEQYVDQLHHLLFGAFLFCRAIILLPGMSSGVLRGHLGSAVFAVQFDLLGVRRVFEHVVHFVQIKYLSV